VVSILPYQSIHFALRYHWAGGPGFEVCLSGCPSLQFLKAGAFELIVMDWINAGGRGAWPALASYFTGTNFWIRLPSSTSPV